MKKQKNLFYYIKNKKTIFIFFFFLVLSPLFLKAEEKYFEDSTDHFFASQFTHLTYDSLGHLELKEIFNESGLLICSITYLYNEEGRIIKETDEKGTGVEKDYDVQGNLIKELIFENNNLVGETLYFYGEQHFPDEIQEDNFEECGEDPYESVFSIPFIWKKVKEMAFSFADAMNKFKENASYEPALQKEWDETAHQLFDKGFLQFAGHYSDPMESGVSQFGEEMHEKVRITLINGILNIRYDLDLMVKLFSASHGDSKIHYVFRPTEGWTKDMFSSVASKLGFTSPQAQLLAKKWKDLIEEMGGVDQGGKIIHYAHSIGATDSYIAKNLLTLEEQRMIHVIAIGSPTMIPNDSGFASVVNYVSLRDGVCLLDPIGYAMGYLYGNSKIEWVGTLWGIPFIDHTLSTDSYGGAIKDLGSQFIKMHRLIGIWPDFTSAWE